MGTDKAEMLRYQQILVHIENGVATLTLNAPDKLNALSPQMLDELNEALDGISTNPDVRVFVLNGAGRGFCAGAELSADGLAG
ncbi:MAG: enoyl-CoA hydratase-related protein, partial [Pseudomonadota bacterium]